MHILAHQVQENPFYQSTMYHLALPQTIVCFITIKRGCEKNCGNNEKKRKHIRVWCGEKPWSEVEQIQL